MNAKNKPITFIESDTSATTRRIGDRDNKAKLVERAYAIVDAEVILTRNKAGSVYVTFCDNENTYETIPLKSPAVVSKVKTIVRKHMNIRLPKSLAAEVVDELIDSADDPTLEIREVHQRIALGEKKQIFIDLCNQQRDVLEVDAEGYRLYNFENESPLFVRPPGMADLPNPSGHAGNLEALRPFLNVPSNAAWRLLLTFLLYSLRPKGPYVILIVLGTAGSSKSTTCRVIRSLLDPSSVSTQALPTSTKDMMITAVNSHLLAFDNARTLSTEISDALCRLSTGGGMRQRALFTDSSEALFQATKPVVVNGITEIASQPDLLSRSIQLELPPIKVRRTEEEFDRSFDSARGPIFAGLMDALSKTLAALPSITDAPQSRMADFYQWGQAVEQALKWPKGSFKTAYAESQREQMSGLLADDPLAQAVKKFMRDGVSSGSHTGTPTEILSTLRDHANQTEQSAKSWPQSPHSLSKRLKKMEPALKACCVEMEFGHSGTRSITLTRKEGFK